MFLTTGMVDEDPVRPLTSFSSQALVAMTPMR